MIDEQRVWNNLQQLGEFGFREAKGITRPALNSAHLRARQWLEQQMRDAGLQIRRDPAGNLIGRLPAGEPYAGQPPQSLVIGSHLDTVPQGGKFDGALGVVAGLECARVFSKSQLCQPWHLEVVDFTDEEGYHYAGTFGSRAMMGGVDRRELHRSKGENVPTLGERFSELGWEIGQIDRAARDPSEIRAYLELHVEQGSRMEERGLQVAAVTGIVGIYRYLIEVRGTADHAGTTPMAHRDDALVKSAGLFRLLPEWARARSPDMVATVGQVAVEPGAQNIVPGRCRFSVELRSLEPEDVRQIQNRMRDWLTERCDSSLTTVQEKDGVSLDPELVDLITTTAHSCGLNAATLISGAGHDAQSFAPQVPTGLLFVPSADGISHSPREYSTPEWVSAGTEVLVQTARRLAKRDASGDQK